MDMCLRGFQLLCVYVVVCLWIEYYKWVDRTTTHRSECGYNHNTRKPHVKRQLYTEQKMKRVYGAHHEVANKMSGTIPMILGMEIKILLRCNINFFLFYSNI